MMRCDEFLDRYDRLDSGEEPGLFLRLHLAACPACRDRVAEHEAALEAIRTAAAEPLDAALEEAIAARVMAAVRLMPAPRRAFHARDWAISGLVIFSSLALVPFDANYGILRELFGEGFTMPLCLVLGLVLTIYGAVFIGTHMTELEPFVKRHLGRAPRA